MGQLSLTLFVLICSSWCLVTAQDDWWESHAAHFYQIYPRSFQDSDGDGIGDLHGITLRLPYLKYISVTGVWLSPIFQSPMKDFGYDISDFQQIHSEYGTMDDFDRLIERCRELDVKLILDFVPNHSSDKHKWFVASANPSHFEHEKYKDYYIWNKGKLLENGTRVPPSNWLSIFRGSAWTWVESRKAYYLHQFLAEQPDLNYRNEALVNEMKEIMRFWLRKGVSGFRCDAVPFLFEAEKNADGLYDDEPLSGECGDDPEASCYLKHTKTQDLDETFDMIYQFRGVTEEDEFKDETRILMTEAYTSLPNTLKFYGKVENGEIVRYGSQIPFNFELISKTKEATTSYEYKAHIEHWLNGMPKGKHIHANWVLGNHDNKRVASRYRPRRIDLFNILLKTLPGITITYMGEEIGMTDVYISWENTVDPQACRTNPDVFHQYSRDPARTPMHWNDEKNAGFSFADKTWLPVASNHTENNVQLQKSEILSHLKVFRQLMALRQNPTMKYGSLKMSAVNKDVFIYKRFIDDNDDADVIVVLLNLGMSYRPVGLSYYFRNLPQQMKVVAASIHSEILVIGDIVDPKKVVIPPEAGIVIAGKRQQFNSK